MRMAHDVHRLTGSNFQPVHILLNITTKKKKKEVLLVHTRSNREAGATKLQF